MAQRKVFTELKEIVDPEHTVLIVWDVQNMLVNRIFNKNEFLESLNSLISSARSKGVQIFFTKITPLPEKFESGIRLSQRRFPGGLSQEQLDLYIRPGEGDIVIPKNTASIFVGTNFEIMMHNAGMKTILFTGIATEIGIESSARDAQNRGFYSVVVEDAVSSGDRDAHMRSLANMKNLLIVSGSKEIIDAWK